MTGSPLFRPVLKNCWEDLFPSLLLWETWSSLLEGVVCTPSMLHILRIQLKISGTWEFQEAIFLLPKCSDQVKNEQKNKQTKNPNKARSSEAGRSLTRSNFIKKEEVACPCPPPAHLAPHMPLSPTHSPQTPGALLPARYPLQTHVLGRVHSSRCPGWPWTPAWPSAFQTCCCWSHTTDRYSVRRQRPQEVRVQPLPKLA